MDSFNTQLWNNYNNKKPALINRLDVAQAAHKLGVKPQDLYNARSSGRDGGFIQKDPITKKLYVLANELYNLRDAMKDRNPGPVVQVHTVEKVDLDEVAKALGIKKQSIYAMRDKGAWPAGYAGDKVYDKSIKRSKLVFDKSIIDVLKSRGRIGKAAGLPAAEKKATPAHKLVSWTLVAKELAKEHPQAALWVLEHKVEA